MIKEYLKILRQRLPIILLAILVCLVLAIFPYFLDGSSICPMKRIFKFPCPACGTTRAYITFFKGHPIKALYYHPLYWILPIIAWIVIFSPRPAINHIYNSRFFWISLIILYIIVYIIRLIVYYPNFPM